MKRRLRGAELVPGADCQGVRFRGDARPFGREEGGTESHHLPGKPPAG